MPHDERSFHDALHAGSHDAFLAAPVFHEVRRRTVASLREKLGLDGESAVLSIGSGLGITERMLAPHVKCVVGVDLSARAVDKARAAAAAFPNLTFECLDVITEGARLEGRRFDAVCLLGVLHHIPEPEWACVLAAVRAALKPGGRVYSLDPSKYRFIGKLKFLVRRAYDAHHSPEERELDPAELRAAMTAAGLEVREPQWFDSFMTPFAYLFPRAPAWVFHPLSSIDRRLAPILGSSFILVARRSE